MLRPLSGRPIDRRDAYRMVVHIAKVAGIPRHISPHSLRHAAITPWSRKIAARAGKSSPDRPTRAAPSPTTAPAANLDRHGVHFLTAYVAGV